MLPTTAAVDGASGTYRPTGVKGFSYASAQVQAKSKDVQGSSFDEMKGGCNAFQLTECGVLRQMYPITGVYSELTRKYAVIGYKC